MTRRGLLTVTGVGVGVAWLFSKKAPSPPKVTIGSLFYASRVYASETQEITFRIYNRGTSPVTVYGTVWLKNVYQAHLNFARLTPERLIIEGQYVSETVRFNPTDFEFSWPKGTYRILIEVFQKGNRTPIAVNESVGTIEVV